MSGKNVFWSLFNEVTGRQIDGLTYAQAKGFLESIPPEYQDTWMAWHEGLPDWKGIKDFPGLLEVTEPFARRQPPLAPPPKRRAQPEPTAPPPEEAPLTHDPQVSEAPDSGRLKVVDYPDDMTQVAIAIEKQVAIDHRLNKRFVKAYFVSVAHSGGMFKTRTVNISLGGMLLVDQLPSTVGSRFTAVLTRLDGNAITLHCLRVAGPVNAISGSRVKFTNSDDLSGLRAWLLDQKTE